MNKITVINGNWRKRFSSHGYPLLISLIVVLVVGGAYAIVEPITWTNDTEGYLEGARWFAGYHGTKYPYWRTPLFPILMALTGVAQGWTLKLLVLIQQLTALLIPLLIYFTLAWVNRWAACLISVAASISLIPFVNSGYVMPNHLYNFLIFATVTCASCYFREKKPEWLYLMALFCFATVMARPQGSYLYLVFFSATLFFRTSQLKHWTAAFAIFLILQTGYMALRPFFVKQIGSPIVLITKTDNAGFIPNDKQLFDRGMAFLASDLYPEARFFSEMIQSPSIKMAFEFAVINRQLLTNKPLLAIDTARALHDINLRNETLTDIYFYESSTGGRIAAATALDSIGDSAVRSRLTAAPLKRYSPIDYSQLILSNESLAPHHVVSGLDLTNTSGKMLLYQVFQLRNYYPKAVLRPENGDSTRLMFKLVEAYWASRPEIMTFYPELWSLRENPAEAARYMLTGFEYPDAHWALWMMLDNILGPAQADKLCTKVYFEFLRVNFSEMMSHYRINFFKSLSQISGATMFFSHSDPVDNRRFSTEIAESQRFHSFYSNPIVLQTYSNIMLEISRPLFIMSAALGIFLFSNLALLRMWCMFWGIAVHQIIICVITAGASFAYVAYSYLFLLMAFGIGLCGALNYWHKMSLVKNH